MTPDPDPEVQPPVIDHVPTPEPAPPPPREPPPDARKPEKVPEKVVVRGGGSNLLTFVLFAVVAGGIYYVWANPQPPGTDNAVADLRRQVLDTADKVSAAQTASQSLTQQIQTLSDRVDKLEKAPPPPPVPAPAPDLGDLPKRVDDLAAKLDALANRPAPEAPQSQAPANDAAAQQAVSDLAQKLGQALDSQKQALADTRQALDGQKQSMEGQTQALQTLQQTADAQKAVLAGLAGRLDKLEQGAGQSEKASDHAVRLAKIQAALVSLEAGEKLGDLPGAPPAVTRFATTTPPTEVALREAYPAAAAHAREVSRPDLSHQGFLGRALARLQQNITVRQGDQVLVGDPAAGILANAGKKLDASDLAGAVAELRKLQGPAADAMKGWMDQANALLAARAALADMAAHG